MPTAPERDFRERVIEDLATIKASLEHLKPLSDRVTSLERDRSRIFGAVAVLSAGTGILTEFIRRHIA